MGPIFSNLCTCATAPPQLGPGLAGSLFCHVMDLILEVETDARAQVNVTLPEVHWLFYALPASILFIAFVVLLKRLIIAWRGRNRPVSG